VTTPFVFGMLALTLALVGAGLAAAQAGRRVSTAILAVLAVILVLVTVQTLTQR